MLPEDQNNEGSSITLSQINLPDIREMPAILAVDDDPMTEYGGPRSGDRVLMFWLHYGRRQKGKSSNEICKSARTQCNRDKMVPSPRVWRRQGAKPSCQEGAGPHTDRNMPTSIHAPSLPNSATSARIRTSAWQNFCDGIGKRQAPLSRHCLSPCPPE